MVGHIYFDWASLGPEFAHLKALDTLIALLAVASRVTWVFLFRDPYRFLYFHRPSRGYRFAVNIISAATIAPSLILHISVVFISSKTGAPTNIGFGTSILQLALLLGVSCLYLWMVHPISSLRR